MESSKLLDYIFKVKKVIDSDKEEVIGTAFIIDDTYAITAEHVVENQDEKQLILESHDGKHKIDKCSIECELRIDSKYIDIAVIKYECNVLIFDIKDSLQSSEINMYDKYETYGYPYLNSNKELNISGEVISPEGRLSITNSRGDCTGITLFKGVSGAPAIINDKIKGIITDEYVTSRVSKPELFVCKFRDIKSYLMEKKFKSGQLEEKEQRVENFINLYCDQDEEELMPNNKLDSVITNQSDVELSTFNVCMGISDKCNKNINCIIERDTVIDQIKEFLDNETEIVVVEGAIGRGKTTVLEQFMKKYKENSLGIFFRNDSINSDLDNIKFDLANQINILINSKMLVPTEYDEKLLKQYIGSLALTAMHKSKNYYFVVDGLEEIDKDKEYIINEIMGILPIGTRNLRFIISEEKNNMKKYLLNYEYKELPLLGFTLDEAERYLEELNLDSDTIKQLWQNLEKNPGKLTNVKKMIFSGTKVEEILSLKNNKWEDLFDVEWSQIDVKDIVQQKMILLLSTNNKLNTILNLSKIFKIDVIEVENKLGKVPFIGVKDNNILFENNLFRKYAKKKLSQYSEEVNKDIVQYLLTEPNQDAALDLLPKYLSITNKFDDLVQYINVENIILMMKKTQSIYVAENNINYGIRAAYRNKYHNDLLRLSLQKSTLLEYQNCDILHSQLDALAALGDYKKALLLTNTVIVKEKRLHLLCIIAKKMYQVDTVVDENILDEIKQLYNEVKDNINNEKAIKIASDLIFVLPNLAIELIEGRKNVANKEDRLDFSLARLSVEKLLVDDKNFTNEEVAMDKDEKIKKSTTRNLYNNIKLLVRDYEFNELKNKLLDLENTSEKIFFLTKWIINNKENNEVYDAIILALDLMFSSTSYTPKVDVFKEITQPLKYIKDIKEIKRIVDRVESQLELLVDKGPTIEYVKLIINLCYGIIKFSVPKSQEKILNLYTYIEDIKDLSIKTISISLLYANIKFLDINNQLEQDLGIFNELEKKLFHYVKVLLDTSANNYEACKEVIKNLSMNYPNVAYIIIQDINLEEYRDKALYTLVVGYLNNKSIDINIKIINKYLKNINRSVLKNRVLLILTTKVDEEKDDINVVRKIFEFLENDVENINEALIKSNVFLNYYKLYNKINSDKKKIYLKKLLLSTNNIEDNWIKVDFSYFVVSELASVNSEDARNIYENISSDGGKFLSLRTGQNLIYSIKLAIRAYSALIYIGNKDGFKRLKGFIDIIPSTQQKIIVWAELATRVYIYKKNDFANEIVIRQIYPLLGKLQDLDKELYNSTMVKISPCLYFNCMSRAYSEIDKLPNYYREYAYYNIVSCICTKTYYSEPFDNKEDKKYNLTCNEIFDLLSILDRVSNDSRIYNLISIISNSIDSVNANQKIDIAKRLDDLIIDKLPDKNNIKHQGYVIVSQSQVMKIKKRKIDVDNIKKVLYKKVNNIADRAYILCVLAGLIKAKDSVKISEILSNAKEIIDGLPSKMDRISHYEMFASMAHGKNGYLAKQALKDAMEIATNGEDKKYINAQRDLIDLAYEIDENLASSLLTLCDKDEVRGKYKKNIEQQSRINKLKDKMLDSDKEEISVKDCREYSNAAWKNLALLNGQRSKTLKYDEIEEYVQTSSNIIMSYSYPIYCWIFENNIKRYIDTHEGIEKIESMFKSAMLSCELATELIAKSNNIVFETSFLDDASIIVNEKERDKAIKYILNWCMDSKPNKIVISDSRFSINELYIIKEIFSILKNCEFEIVTTFQYADKYVDKGSSREDSFCNEWLKIANIDPPECTIKMLQYKKDNTSPIKNYWILGDKSGLVLDCPISELGRKIVKISHIDRDDTFRNYEIINKFTSSKLKNIDGKIIKKSSFTLV